MGYHNVFVYGTLKGMDKSLSFKARFVGRGRTTEGDYQMWGGGFPCVRKAPDNEFGKDDNGHVLGELYVVDDATLKALDNYEGAPSFYAPEMVPITLENGVETEALMYLGKGVLSSIPHRPKIMPEGTDLYWPFPREHQEDAGSTEL